MNSPKYIPDAEFAPAPPGTRVRLTTLCSFVAVFLAITVVLVMVLKDQHPPPGPVVGGIGLVPVAFSVGWFLSRIRHYRLVGNELRVELALRTVRFPLEGLIRVDPDREAMHRAWRTCGNDGLGAISGRFRSKRLGAFRAYLTDVEHAVVLRWADRCVVISPHPHSYFVEAVRKRAGLSS